MMFFSGHLLSAFSVFAHWNEWPERGKDCGRSIWVSPLCLQTTLWDIHHRPGTEWVSMLCLRLSRHWGSVDTIHPPFLVLPPEKWYDYTFPPHSPWNKVWIYDLLCSVKCQQRWHKSLADEHFKCWCKTHLFVVPYCNAVVCTYQDAALSFWSPEYLQSTPLASMRHKIQTIKLLGLRGGLQLRYNLTHPRSRRIAARIPFSFLPCYLPLSSPLTPKYQPTSYINTLESQGGIDKMGHLVLSSYEKNVLIQCTFS